MRDRCFVVDSPQETAELPRRHPVQGQTQFKLHGVFPFKADFAASFAFQNLSGPNLTASYTAQASEIDWVGQD